MRFPFARAVKEEDVRTCPSARSLLTPLLLTFLVATSVTRPSPVAAAAQLGQHPAADEPGRTGIGHVFIVPRGWTRSQLGRAVILQAPEASSRVAIVEVDAHDADAAVAEAWNVYRPGSKPDLLMSLPASNRDGWQDVRSYVYRTLPNAARLLTARAMRHGKLWSVRIDDLETAVNAKRSAELALIRDEFLPAGYTRESFAGHKARRLDRLRLDALRSFIETSRRTLGIPGIAVGIVQDGRIVLAEGYGVREVGKADRVDADTLFPIASNTKPLTTLMLAKLVDEGRLSWETPVAELLPRFRLADPDSTRKVRVKHLLCACTGLPYRNLDWEFAPANSNAAITFDILSRMRSTSPFGTTYQYSNPIAAAAGYVGGQAAYPGMELGKAYDEAMESRVFAPLKMRRTTFDFNRAMQANYARSHGVSATGQLGVVDSARDRQMHAVRPAGGAWSSVNDLLSYVRMELSGGLLDDGRRYISEAALKARWARQVSIGRHSWYGMGLQTSLSAGTSLLFHGGRLYGQRGDMFWLPEHGVGAVILMNASTGNVLMDAFPRKLMEILFDGRPEADSMVAAAAAADREQRMVSRRLMRFPAATTHVRALAGQYRNEFLGDLRVKQSNGQTIFEFAPWSAPVASRESADGTVEFVVNIPSPPFPFVAGKSGDRRTLTMRDAQNDYVFVER